MARPKKTAKSNVVINPDIEIGKIKYESTDNKIYCCTACGKTFKKQETNFCKSQSPLFANNNGFVHICKKCTDKYYFNLVDFFSGSEEKAMDKMCQIFDWYYSDEIFAITRKISADKSRVCAYPAKVNLPQYEAKGKTYADTIADRADNYIHDISDIENMKADGKTNITKAMFERWGQVSADDMTALEEHYKMLKKYNPNADSNQEIFIKDLCFTKLLQLKAFKDGNSGDFEKYTKLYSGTFRQAGLRIAQEADASTEETLGVTLATISQYTPEEYYKDKQLYKDFDGLGKYLDRHLLRPLKNLIFGTGERDPEYSVKDDDCEE